MTFSLLCLTGAVWSTRIVSPTLGPGLGVYHHYALFWIGVGAALILVVVGCWTASRFPWGAVVAIASLAALAVVSLSATWGYPFGYHDGWVHLARIKAVELNPTTNVYPLFHSGVIIASEVFDIASQTILTRAASVSVVVGVLFLTVVARRVPAGRRARQTAVVVGVPAVFLSLVPRPFTVSVPFVLLFYWFVFSLLGISLSRLTRAVLASLFVTLAYFHPLVTLLIFLVGGGAYTVIRGTRHVDGFGEGSPTGTGRKTTPTLLLLIALPLVAHLLLVATVGERLLGSLVVSLLSDVGTSQAAPDQGTTTIAAAFSSTSALLEFLTRASYVLAFALVAVVALGRDIYTHRVRIPVAITIVAGGAVASTFLVLSLLTSGGIGLHRLFLIAPVVAFPAVAGGFGHVEKSMQRGSVSVPSRLAAVVVAAMIITAGLATAFQSPLTGGVGKSANKQQVEGVRWLKTYSPPQVVGSSMTFWIMRGLYGTEVTARLSATGGNGIITTQARSATFSWGVTDRASGALYVVDTVERLDAKRSAVEGNPRGLQCLRTFQREQSRIYQNSDTSLYLLSTDRSTRCRGG